MLVSPSNIYYDQKTGYFYLTFRDADGEVEIVLDLDDAKFTHETLGECLKSWEEDMAADAAAENEALQRAEEEGIRRRETDLEIAYSQQGYDRD